MAQKPDKIGWGTSSTQEPSDPKKATGWNIQEKPPRNYFNWKWYLDSLIQFFVFGESENWIVISDDTDEQDYATLATYIADAPAAGDKVLVKETQVLTAQMIIPDSITLRILDGVNFTRSTLDATSVIKIGSNIVIEGLLNLILSQTGTTAKAIEINGDNSFGDIIVENSSTGILTDAFAINAGKVNNQIRGIAKNSGGGTLTNVLTDSSASESNNVIIANNATGEFARSDGAKAFRDGLEFNLGSDANGDIYYRDAGVLKRLAKGSDGEILKLASGLPSWGAVASVSVRDVTRNLIIQNTVANPTFQMDIDADEALLQDSTGLPFRAVSVNETIDITSSGVNGLDAPSEAADTWYFIWIIAKADGTVGSLISLSSTAPTMPSGYTFKALVGAIYNDSGSDFIVIRQDGPVVKREVINVLNGGSATSPTQISLASVIPTTAIRVMGAFNAFDSTSTADPFTYLQDSNALNRVRTRVQTLSGIAWAPLEVSSDLYYLVGQATTSADVEISGWKY